MDWLSGLNQAVEYMEKNLSGAIRYEDMARMVGCSVYEFSRVFSFVAGGRPAENLSARLFSTNHSRRACYGVSN